MANAEVAKRIAMSTNSQSNIKKPVSDKSQSKKGKSSKSNSQNSQKKTKWKAGMPCRAVYEEDGLEYEACLLTVLNDMECVVRFLGYKNSEVVPLTTLKQSEGEEARARQIEEALACDEQPNDYMSHSSQPESVVNSDHGEQAQRDMEMPPSRRSKSPKKKKRSKNHKLTNGFDLPEMPYPMPNLDMLMNMGSNDLPLPPPPPMMSPSPAKDSEDQAISSMLLSWYMSGYYTGLYQGLKRSKENGRNK
ncbi:survival motor neuron protein isoform X2 [Plodia interpunctella]|nr:survival motor neuron protein isoform X2 [Plodia interpunctella]